MDFVKINHTFDMDRLVNNTIQQIGAGMLSALIFHARTCHVELIALNGLSPGIWKKYPYQMQIISVEYVIRLSYIR
jgi:hypothetical protein